MIWLVHAEPTVARSNSWRYQSTAVSCFKYRQAMRSQNAKGASAYPIEISGWLNRVDWVLLLAVVTTFLNGLLISLFIFPNVAGPVGLVTGPSDGWAEIAENIVRGNGFVWRPGAPATATTGYLTREPVYALFLAGILALFGDLDP